jgi:hypothetical protein
MATIKSYTDLEQSKKLAEILPLESADMYYEEICNLPKAINGNYILHNQCMEDKDYKKLSNPVLSPAWSLAALLSVLPDYALQTNTDGTVFVVCDSKKPMISDSFSNPVDACVAIIEKLHELNLL